MHKGTLKAWNDRKGFGFIKSDTLQSDTFIHISALKHMSRKPKVGDTICFDVAQQPDGKTKAVNCAIEGVVARNTANEAHKQLPHIDKSNFANRFLGKAILIIFIVGLCLYAFTKFTSH